MYCFEFYRQIINDFGDTIQTWIVFATNLAEAEKEVERIGGNGAIFRKAYPATLFKEQQ